MRRSRTCRSLITNDTTAEGSERFKLTLNNPSGASIANGTGTVVIGASDAGQVSKPLISVGPDMVISEGDAAGFVDVPVTLSAPAPSDVSVRLLTVQGTAHQFGQPDPDYVATDVTMTFAPGETTKTVRIDLVNDVDVEPLQSFTVELGNISVNASFARALARIDIVDDDTLVGSPRLFVRDAAGGRGGRDGGRAGGLGRSEW